MRGPAPFADAHTHRDSSGNGGALRVVNLAPPLWSYDGIALPCAGIHPREIGASFDETRIAALEELLPRAKAVAVGECGLDRLAEAPLELQTRVFKAQAAIAERLKLPLAIHCVKAFPELIAAKNELKPKSQWFIHGFRGGHETAQALLGHGFMLSFGAALLNPAPELHACFRQTQEASLLLETDESPHSIEEVYAKAAELRGASLYALKESVFENFSRVFGSEALSRAL